MSRVASVRRACCLDANLDLEARLDPRRFVRIHRSHVVNLDFIVAIEPHEGSRLAAVLQSGARVVASRPGAARLKAMTS